MAMIERVGPNKFRLRFENHLKKDAKKIVEAKTKRQAEKKLYEILDDIENGTYEAKHHLKVTLFEIIEDHLRHFRLHEKHSTKTEEYRVIPLKKFFGDVSCKQITHGSIETYMEARKRGNQPFDSTVAGSTIDKEIKTLRTIFNRAIKSRKVVWNPAKEVELFSPDNRRTRILTEIEFKSLIMSAPPHLKPILITGWETGMRKGEVLQLRWNWINFEKRIIVLPKDLPKENKLKKNPQPKRIPISDNLYEILDAVPRIHDRVFTYKGTPLKYIRNSFNKACRRAGISNFQFRDFRRTCRTRFRKNGVHDDISKAIFGHSSDEMHSYYDQVGDADLLSAVGVHPEKTWKNSGRS